ncbi:MAG: heme ABC exporter ATP-binding protein CcmA, partial [Rhodobacteraceae bacterium]
ETLACRRAGRRVFAGVSFRVGAGEAATLRGPNGSGKSTLLRVLAGLLAPEEGDARFGPVSLAEDPDGFRQLVAYAGHLDAVKPQLTVAENLSVWADLYGGARSPAAALARFGLSRIADYPAAYCSAGQKRRLGLARLMVIDRPLWLLDEPTVSLDAASTAVFVEVVRAHLARGGVAIAATHVPIGLEGGPVIALDAVAPAAPAAADDPFLQGAWS